MKEAKLNRYIVKRGSYLTLKGKKYRPGDIVELAAKEAQALRRSVEPAPATEKSTKSNTETVSMPESAPLAKSEDKEADDEG